MTDHRQFRQALGSFPTGVAIITTVGPDGRKAGLTVNSFSSVSLTPRLVLWSLDRNSSSFPVCMAAEYFAAHILAADQEGLAKQFCTRGIDRFAGVDITQGHENLPLLNGCAAVFECRTVHRYDGGDHVIFVGEVLEFSRAERESLTFYGGRYSTVIKWPDTGPDPDANIGVDLMMFTLRRAYSQLAMPLRQPLQRYGLHDVHRTILSVMGMGEGRSVDQTNALLSLSGHQVQPGHYEDLRRHNLIELREEGREMKLYFTAEGMALAIEQAAIGKRTEEEALSVFEPQEIALLKKLLQKLIHKTSEGLPAGLHKQSFWRNNNIWGAPAEHAGQDTTPPSGDTQSNANRKEGPPLKIH